MPNFPAPTIRDNRLRTNDLIKKEWLRHSQIGTDSAAYHPLAAFFPTWLSIGGMAKNGFGEYITFAVILRRCGSYFAPRGLCEEREKMTMRLLVTIALLSLVVALALPPMAAADAAADYKTKCQACHGPGGVPSEGMAKSMGLKPLGG